METQDRLFSRIKALPRLTPGEARIADYFQRSRFSLAFETVSSISRQTGLSKATVVRFISRLGYDGFADFQKRLKDEIMERLESPITRYASPGDRDDGGEDYLESHIAASMSNLGELREKNSPALIRETARLLAGCEGNLYVLGMLTSHGMAHVFWSLSNYLRPGVILLDNRASNLPNQMVNVSEKDVLLAVTHRRYSRQTDLALHHFSRLGARSVLLTDSDLTPVSSLADYILVAPSEGPYLFDSHCCVVILVETLLAAMADFLQADLHRRFQTMDGLYGHFQAFSPGLEYSLEQRVENSRAERLDRLSGKEEGGR